MQVHLAVCCTRPSATSLGGSKVMYVVKKMEREVAWKQGYTIRTFARPLALTCVCTPSPPPLPHIPPLSFPNDPPLYCRVFLEILGLMVQMALLVRWDYLENRFVYKQDVWKVAASLQKHVHRPSTVSSLQDKSLIYCRRHNYNYVSVLVLHQNSKSHMSQFPITGPATWPAWKHTQCSWTANRGHHALPSALRHSWHIRHQ